mmetsp:Transcript_2363/g.3640  ORF Transcript_2363/g.3640 Transcript_2363/m.3640 type:complete len:299 (-) Transcript_2363:31-927(-)
MTSNPIQQYAGDEKLAALQMIDLVTDGLEKSWTITPQKKKKKLEELHDIRQQISAIDDSMVGMVLENSVTSNCLPGFSTFGQRRARKELTKQLAATLKMLQKQTDSVRTDVGTAGDNDSIREDVNRVLLEFDDSDSVDESAVESLASHNISALSPGAYDADGEEDYKNMSFSSKDSDLSDGSDAVVVTTSELASDASGPLGVSITTWRRGKMSDLNKENCSTKDNASATEKESSDDDDDAYQNTLEEISVSFGSSLVVRATKQTKKVRFADLKPTTEDNINRARELLRNARQMKKSQS